MTTSEIRGASKITDSEFLAAYNDAKLDNAAVIKKLSTDWNAIGVKLRSERVKLHTTVVRIGGAKGSAEPIAAEKLSLEAKAWLKDGTVQSQPAKGGYVPLADRENGNTSSTTTKTASTASTTSTASTSASNNASEFSFTAELFGTRSVFNGTDRNDAMNKLFTRLQELNFSKVTITNSNGTVIGINEIANNGFYVFKKQMTAAYQ